MSKTFATRAGHVMTAQDVTAGRTGLLISAQTRVGAATLPVFILADDAERIASAAWDDESLTVNGIGGSVSVNPARGGSSIKVESPRGTVSVTLTGKTLTDFTRWMTGE